MFLEKLNIKFFRNYQEAEIHLKKGINILVGDNAQGKTNLLEAIYVLGMSKSYRSFSDEVLINNNSKVSRITGIIKEESIKTKLEIQLSEKNKILKVDNEEIKSIQNYLSHLRIIIFFPEDLNFIKDGPEIRRKYINLQISQLYKNFVKVLNDYNKLLKTRNEYIRKVKYNESYNKEYYQILNDYYIKKAILLYRMKKKYVDKINEYIAKIFFDITGLDGLCVVYNTNIFFDQYNDEEMYKNMKTKIDDSIKEEISYGKSIYGPHRDDFNFILNGQDLKYYGSQGQQRAAILALKLSEIKIFEKATGSNPILLLDDVFSELDEIKRNNLLKYIENDIQVLITTTDLYKISHKLIKKAKIFNIKEGKIESIKGDKNGTK